MWFKSFAYKLAYFPLAYFVWTLQWPTTQPAFCRKLELGSLEILPRNISFHALLPALDTNSATISFTWSSTVALTEIKNQASIGNVTDFSEVFLEDQLYLHKPLTVANWIQDFKIQFSCLSCWNVFAFYWSVKPEQYSLILYSRRPCHPVLQEGRLANLDRGQKARCKLWLDLCPEWQDRQNRECISGGDVHHSFSHKALQSSTGKKSCTISLKRLEDK